MIRILVLAVGILLAGWLVAVLPGSAGELQRHSFQSERMGREFHYTVYLPDDYRAGQKSYAVLYLLHGAYGTDGSWTRLGQVHKTADSLIAAGDVPPFIIVMPGCKGCWWVDEGGSKSQSVFWHELVPEVSRKFRVIGRREGRFVAGNSMGGYGAIRYALLYPERIAAAAALSPAIYAESPPKFSAVRRQRPFVGEKGRFNADSWHANNYPSLLPSYLLQPYRVGFYLASGDHDRLGIAFETALLFKRLFDAGQRNVELRIRNGGHTWQLWRENMRGALQFLGQYMARPEDVAEIVALAPLLVSRRKACPGGRPRSSRDVSRDPIGASPASWRSGQSDPAADVCARLPLCTATSEPSQGGRAMLLAARTYSGSQLDSCFY
ncbi:MAG: Endo,4-beta-xylanase [Pseudomonadota bacterium]|jgi:enterochelin esterase-like enzyme